MTVGSRSQNNALGTCFPADVSLKNALYGSSSAPMLLTLGIAPSGWMPALVNIYWFQNNSGSKWLKYIISLPITVGSRSQNNALGTCLPPGVSLKNALYGSSSAPMDLSLGITPSGWMPCSRQYNSQHALPIWQPAWPIWREMISRCWILRNEHNIVNC